MNVIKFISCVLTVPSLIALFLAGKKIGFCALIQVPRDPVGEVTVPSTTTAN